MNYRKLIPILTAVGVLVAACSDDGGTAEVDSARVNQDETSLPAPTTAADGEDTEDAERSREVGETTEESSESGGTLGSTSGQLSDRFATSTVPLTLDVTSLQRSGEHVELQMTLTVDVDDPGEDFSFCVCDSLSDTTDTGGAGGDISGVRLIDQDEQMAYLPIVDSGGVCVCSNNLTSDIAPGASIELSATFGGLPPDVDAVDLEVPGFSPIPDLRIQG